MNKSYVDEHKFRLFLLLLCFHFFVSLFMSLIANSNLMLPLHNGQGLWNFSLDSNLYNEEARHLLSFLEEGDISSWWNGNQLFYHVRWIALSYFLLGDNPFSFELFNGPAWALTTLSMCMLCKIIGDGLAWPKWVIYAPAVLFSFLPSFLLATTQLLKDPIYILGLSLIFLGWGMLYCNVKKWQSIIFISIGFLLSVLMRPYIGSLFFSVLMISLIFVFLFCLELRLITVIGMVALSLCFFAVSPTNFAEAIVNKLASRRILFTDAYFGSGSSIDRGVKFKNVQDIIDYIPRALQIGFLAPFPDSWLDSGKQTGRIGRIISGAETLMLYFLLLGSIFFILLVALVLSVVTILLLGLVVNNIGALYRMRTGFLMPFYIMGVYGLYELKNRVKCFVQLA